MLELYQFKVVPSNCIFQHTVSMFNYLCSHNECFDLGISGKEHRNTKNSNNKDFNSMELYELETLMLVEVQYWKNLKSEVYGMKVTVLKER